MLRSNSYRGDRMDYHHHARLTIYRREELAETVIQGRLSLQEAAAEFKLSRQSAAKWVRRFRQAGHGFRLRRRGVRSRRHQSREVRLDPGTEEHQAWPHSRVCGPVQESHLHAHRPQAGLQSALMFHSATQNEINAKDATNLINNGVKVVAEGANMPSTLDATKLFLEAKVLYGPAKAANEGGVATSGLETSQNSPRLNWTREEVDDRLHKIMIAIHKTCF